MQRALEEQAALDGQILAVLQAARGLAARGLEPAGQPVSAAEIGALLREQTRLAFAVEAVLLDLEDQLSWLAEAIEGRGA